MSSLGKTIVKARVDKGMKQKALWQASGLSQRYLSAVEHGRADPSVSVLRRIAHALGLSAADLLRATDEPALLSCQEAAPGPEVPAPAQHP
jgi:transcriptional regulator with XRE-family HTH domain